MSFKDILLLAREKVIALSLLTIFFYLCYFLIPSISFIEPKKVLYLTIDNKINFDSNFTILYLSIFIYMPFAWIFIKYLFELKQFAFGIVLQNLVAVIFFTFYPMFIDRPILNNHDLYFYLIKIDKSTNTFPSLHASFTVYSFLWINQIFKNLKRFSLLIRFFFFVWGVLILYSTLAIKQHVVIDLLSGGLFAILIFFILINWFKNE